MRKLSFKKGSWILIPVIILSFFANPAKADTFRTEGANDFYFQLEVGTTFTARADAWSHGIDSQLWLYNSEGTVVAVNDDYFYLDSYISYVVQQSGTYRLRTSVCCGDPNRWYNQFYTVDTSSTPTNAPETTTTTSSTTTTSTTTTSTTTTTTTLPPLVMASPTNLEAHAYEGSIALSWDAPQEGEGYAHPEHYAVFFSDDNWQTSYAISTGNTWAVVYNLVNGTEYQFRVRADNDTLHVYSSLVETYTVRSTPVTTTTSTTTTTTSTTTTSSTLAPTTTTTSTTTIAPEPETTTTTVEEVVPPPVETLPTENTTVSIPEINPTPVPTPEIDITPVEIPVDPTPTIEVPQEVQDTVDSAVADIFDSPISDAKLGDAIDNLVADVGTPEELTAVVNSLLDQELTDSQFATVIDSVFSEPLSDENFSAAVEAVFDDTSKLSADQFDAAVEAVFSEPLSDEQFSAAIEAIFDEPISDEKFASVIDSVLDEPLSNEQFEAVVGILESDSVSEEQVSNAVDSILELGVTEDQATDLATSAKVLESIDADQATDIFQEIPVADLSPTEEAALVETLTNAPTDIKEAFEGAIDIFGEGLDDYVPTGSGIDVKARRALIAVTAVTTTLAGAPAPSSGGSGPSGGGPSGGGSPSGDESSNNDRKTRRSRRK